MYTSIDTDRLISHRFFAHTARVESVLIFFLSYHKLTQSLGQRSTLQLLRHRRLVVTYHKPDFQLSIFYTAQLSLKSSLENQFIANLVAHICLVPFHSLNEIKPNCSVLVRYESSTKSMCMALVLVIYCIALRHDNYRPALISGSTSVTTQV